MQLLLNSDPISHEIEYYSFSLLYFSTWVGCISGFIISLLLQTISINLASKVSLSVHVEKDGEGYLPKPACFYCLVFDIQDNLVQSYL